MRKILGIVKNNQDPDVIKKVKVSLLGLTDDIPAASLPWAVPTDPECIVPALNDKVWVYVDQVGNEDYDYSRLFYSRWTEGVYKEAFQLNQSSSYQIKQQNRVTSGTVAEPVIPSSVEYPKNRVVKISNITIEMDEGNMRFEITDESGNYLRFSPSGIVMKSQANEFHVVAQDYKERIIGNMTTQAAGNIIKAHAQNDSTGLLEGVTINGNKQLVTKQFLTDYMQPILQALISHLHAPFTPSVDLALALTPKLVSLSTVYQVPGANTILTDKLRGA